MSTSNLASNSSATSSSESLLTTLSNLNLGNGLINFGALTTLIGSTVAESLVLGNRGTAGISWAAMSAFGTFSIIRACMGAAMPGWIRETLGLRTKACDLAVGMRLRLDGRRKVRDMLGSPLAIMCQDNEMSDVYAFDQATSALLEGTTEPPSDSSLVVYTYPNLRFFAPSKYHVDLIFMLLSLLKITEIYVLWESGGLVLGIATALPWSVFFSIAVAILITEKHPTDHMGSLDLLTGQLPSVKRIGGRRLVVLGLHGNPRSTFIWWRVAWSIGALVCTSSILVTYANLSSQPSIVVILWTAFQFLWLVARIIVHYSTASSDQPRMLAWTPLHQLSPELKSRLLNLTLALGKSLTYVHPRGEGVYRKDLFSSQRLPAILDSLSDQYPLEDEDAAIHVVVKAVIGDTVLSAAAWIIGSKMSSMDLYDSCVVMVSYSGKIISVPAVRVLSGPDPVSATDPENPHEPAFVPKGSGNLGHNLKWHYWIPTMGETQSCWLHFAVPGAGALGKHDAEVLTDAQVNAMLSAGQLNIGLRKVDELRDVLRASSMGAQAFRQFY
ncbi:hypothetical protein BDP27DRAFT_1334650 [Rhodocollybia butyracea]|uniref:Uncharacterized protein n=1 Tax=Rhodocollybia butyracea TaxID=206335 RepID=A0A9P5U1K9_9AGAR|nr:hypothetical protein BDP27DRAFT_1334650 [Rhodocollybia butyracea]